MIQTDITKAVELIKAVLNEKSKNEDLIIAIDGNCAAGKTTLANALKKELDCNIIHVDDFFLRPHQRTKERLEAAGGNFDKERLLREVILPLKSGKEFSFRPYDCKSQKLSSPVIVTHKAITFIEGVYSCHPDLYGFYDYGIFVKVGKETQLKRLENRNALILNRFLEEWIPMEEKYFKAFDIESKCDLVISL